MFEKNKIGKLAGLGFLAIVFLIAGIAEAVTFTDDLLPSSNNIYSVGADNPRWKDGYFSGNVSVSGDLIGNRLCLNGDCKSAWSSISGITGSGTTNYLAKWSSNSALTNSLLTDDGTNVKLITSSSTGFQVYPSGYPSQALYLYGGREATDSLARVWSDGPINIATKDGTNGYILFSSGASGTSSGTELMRIKANGNVGINNNNPSEKLDVAGNIQLGQYNGVKMKNFSNNSFTAMYNDSSNRLILRTALDADLLTIDQNNRVGIGTTSPGVKFEIYGNFYQTQARLFSSGDNGTNTALLYLWASEPGLTYTGAGIGNNAYNYSGGGIVRSSTERGGSYIRLLDNSIRMNVINASGTDTNAIVIGSSGSVTISGNLTVNGTVSGGGAVPSGLIAIFDASCPSGWTRVSAWDGKTVRGASSYGGTGGSDTHQHSVDPPSTATGAASTRQWATSGSDGSYSDRYHTHTIDISAFNSAATSSWAPYIDVVFCKKN